MKKTLFRVLAALTALCLLTGSVLAADSGFRELRPPSPFTMRPNWVEMDVTVESGENILRGTLTCPNEIAEEMPVAILMHGLNTDRHWCDDIAMCLAENGIVSVRFDFNGNGQSDGAQEDMTISKEVADVNAILDYVEGLKFTDPDNIFLVGKSMGGVDSVLAASGRQDEINALCLWYPAFALCATTKFGFFMGAFFNPFNPPETLEIAGYTYGRELLIEAGAIDFQPILSELDLPVLIIHGDQDGITPLPGSIWASEQLPDCQLHVVPGGEHGFTIVPEMLSLQDTLSFLKAHIK